MKRENVKIRWSILVIAVLAFILVPFFLFGNSIESRAQAFILSATDTPMITAAVLAALLAFDIVLPVPSSIVSTACGYLLGFWSGAFTSCIGMVVSCLVGYILAAGVGGPLARRLLGQREMERLKTINRRYGDWLIVLTRPIPVLAEAAVIFAGMGQMRFARFVVLSTLSNLGVSVVYAAAGAFSSRMDSTAMALAGSICLPLVFIIVGKSLYRPDQNQDAFCAKELDS